MRGHHHGFFGQKAKRSGRSLVDDGLRFVVARDFRAGDRVPMPAIVSGQIDHQTDVAVRAGRQHKLLPQPRQPPFHIRPLLQAVPAQVQLLTGGFVHLMPAQAFKHDVQIAPVQFVQLAKAALTAAHFFHGRLVLVAPVVCEGVPVGAQAERRQQCFGLVRNAAAPVDQGAEYVKNQCFGSHVVRLFQNGGNGLTHVADVLAVQGGHTHAASVGAVDAEL